jgi:hypothetical protein
MPPFRQAGPGEPARETRLSTPDQRRTLLHVVTLSRSAPSARLADPKETSNSKGETYVRLPADTFR